MANRKYKLGSIWQIPDEEIKFPKDLFRNHHHSRLVVIVENSNYNFNNKENCILVAPLSSQILEYHQTDILINPNELNNLEKKSYIRMRAIQFISKSLLKKYIGKINDDQKYDILFTTQSYFNYGQV